MLLLGDGWAVVSRVWLAWKGRLHPGLLRGFRGRDNRPRFFQAAGRASFWAVTAVACLAVFPQSAEMTPLVVLPSLSVGEMTLRLYGVLNYSQNSARDLCFALNRA